MLKGTRPEILCHPNIPKPLHSVAPRNIKGKERWDETRQEVYKKYDYCCAACWVHKTNAKKHKRLEAHEFWEIDYSTWVCKISSIEPLCHYCHNFIHSWRLRHLMGKDKSIEEVREILEDWIKILRDNKLDIFFWTKILADSIGIDTSSLWVYTPINNPSIGWNDFKLIFEWEEYRSKFSSYEEWKDYYSDFN
jgi:hypothetical protein